MDPEQLREFAVVERDILRKLRCHAYIDDEYLVHQFQYLVLPSFTDPISWDLFGKRRRDQPEEYRLFRTTWHCDLDREKLRTPVERLRHPYPLEPNIEVHQLAAPSCELGRLAADLSTLKLQINPSSRLVGLDGVTFEIAIEQPPDGTSASARCRFSWWCEPPAEWDDLRSWLRRAETLFELAWQEKGEARPITPRLPAIDMVVTRQEARRQFLAGHYARATELLMDVASREKLAPSESKMLELALKQVGAR